ncbi:DNA polymerase II large subunit [Nitrososphaera sp. AFS]|uniref:DNA polymerase II large subunit n=1 Tax=Nitrososphaera sp. AFS TaxID=2301191 RepID=UPI001F2CFE14|nr:DNA polymerase II large subunit [Nitrososphaera sp. AFS]
MTTTTTPHGTSMIDEAQLRLRDISMPSYYLIYQNGILKNVEKCFGLATQARKLGLDPVDKVEPKIAYDLADRVAKMHNIDIADRLRALLAVSSKEKAAFTIAEEIALAEYGDGDLRTRLDNAVRVSLAIVTEGMTIAPLQGIADVQIKSNKDSSQYLSISFAGPIRSAGGTEAAFTMLIADHVRKITGLGKYVANSYDDETGRFIEELRVYEREVGNFQFKVLDEDLIKCITSLPVELDGIDTDPVEVLGHRGMKRISTDRVRGGALRVMNDGLIGRSRKLLKMVETLKLSGWNWLKELQGAIQTGTDDAATHRMSEVITGRPVLSMSKKIGGFRLRYGRSFNTGLSTIGIHPTVLVLLDHAIVVGTQIKIDVPGKASSIAVVDTIEPPIVRLQNGNVIQVFSVEQAELVRSNVEKILYMGDILISYGDFLENNAQLLPASYVEEVWALHLREKILASHTLTPVSKDLITERLIQLSNSSQSVLPSVKEAFEISEYFGIPLHPKYSYYWDCVNVDEVLLMKEKIGQYCEGITKANALSVPSNIEALRFVHEPKIKDILERLGIPHSLNSKEKFIEINDQDVVYSLTRLLNPDPSVKRAGHSSSSIENNLDGDKTTRIENTLDFISKISGIAVRAKFASSIAVRVGRPEKAAERKMKPPVHVLFPIGVKGGPTRDILKAAKDDSFYADIANRFCYRCKLPSVGIRCRNCQEHTPIRNLCVVCKEEILDETNNNRCYRCGKGGKTYSPVNFSLRNTIDTAQRQLGIIAQEPLKGVKSLMSQNRSAEVLEKGILRQKSNLFSFKDGTVRFDATNEPMTHFKGRWIGSSIQRLRNLGYTRDYLGQDLVSPDQTVELMMQDVILPLDCSNHLLNVAAFVDEELVKLYGLEPLYNASTIDDLVGHIVIGLAPHTSVGIIGRIIGFTNSQVCLAHPIWHSAKRRDCDGDADSIMLLSDAFLNFSYDFLPDKIGGLMDAPLLIQPIVLPNEVQRQAHNIDVASAYPLEFYESTLRQDKAADLADKIEIIKDRLGKLQQFSGYGFTHLTDLLTTNTQRSAYSRLNSMDEKLEMQLATAKLINAVDPDEVASMVLTTHILPDIMGNMRSYSSQSFRCSNCGEKYRRMPLAGKCIECQNELLQTVTRGSVEKYANIATNICNQFKVNEYLRGRVESLIMELKFIFKERPKEQFTLTEFMES